MRRERAGGIGLVILAADFSRAGEVRRVVDFKSDYYALLVVAAQEPPAALVEHDTHVLRVADGALSLVRPASVNNWSRGFSLETIRLPSGEAQIVRPDLSKTEPPIIIERAAPQPVPTPAPRIEQHVILALGGYSLHPDEAKRWPEGAIFVRDINRTPPHGNSRPIRSAIFISTSPKSARPKQALHVRGDRPFQRCRA
jgi:hypothetical protein